MSIQEASKYLSEGFHFNRGSFHALKQAYKLIMILIIPAYAWEDLKFRNTFGRTLNVLKTNLVNFSESFSLSEVGAFLAVAIPAIVISLEHFANILIPHFVWIIIIVVSSFLFVASVYVENIIGALIFLYNVRLEKEGKNNSLYEKMPQLLKEFDDLLFD